MIVKLLLYVLLPVVIAVVTFCKPTEPIGVAGNSKEKSKKTFGEIALAESAIPLRPGEPGKAPFWNSHARQFIYAPAFDYKVIPGATKYQYEIIASEGGKKFTFESTNPYTSLSEIWASVPVGHFNLTVTGLSNSGENLGLAGSGKYYRAAPFNGPYHQPVIPYDKSAMLALENLLQKDYVTYWFTHKKPDPGYVNYRYPAKIYSALVIGAITYARLKPNSPEAKKATELAQIVADFMLDIRYKPGSAWENFVPTYYGNKFPKEKPHMNPVNNFTIMGVDAGIAFLDLYDLTKDTKYLQAAKLISQTYLKNQMANGSWHQFVHFNTNKPVAENIAIPTAVINYFDRLKNDYQVTGLESPTKRALEYIMDNPVKTFNWQGQFEDIAARGEYVNQSREQACDMAIFLFRNKQNIKLAEELLRFAEDQFVIWERPEPLIVGKNKPESGYNSLNWITPTVQEQTVFWMPVGRAAGIMVEAYWHAYEATKNDIYLAKAQSIANAFTLTQQANNGDYPTFFTKYPMNRWLNSTVYPAKVLMNLDNNMKKLN